MSLSEIRNVVYVLIALFVRDVFDSCRSSPFHPSLTIIPDLVALLELRCWVFDPKGFAVVVIAASDVHQLLLFSNPVWAGANTVPTTIIRNITALSSQIAYEERVSSNITTLTTTNADTLNGVIQGLLYVPDISRMPSCDSQQYDFIPKNVTRRSNLPPTNYNLIAIAPWFSIDCTMAYLNSARGDPLRAFVFYRPNNSSNKPQDVTSAIWNLDDNGAWKKQNQYPIFAVSGLEGQKMMSQLSLYSGSVDQIPHGTEITQLYGPNPKDYVRIWTELSMKNETNLPALWIFFLIVLGALFVIIGSVSLSMHLLQRRRRKSLQRRVESGEVDLEAMGVKRLTVPAAHVGNFPLFTYNQDPDGFAVPPTPTSPGAHAPSRSARSSRRGRRQEQRSMGSDIMSPSTRSVRSSRSVRSKRSSITGSDTTATNFQPNCHICLVAFEHRVTVIRELPCGHIFHTECIDEFLLENSSLCPMCKQCMLPRGYSPPITNGMVRRERALRRLRERVELDYSSLESGESKFKGWGKRLFSSSGTAVTSPDVPMTPIVGEIAKKQTTNSASPADIEATGAAITTAIPEIPDPSSATETSTETPPVARRMRTRRPQPRALRLLPTQPEDDELRTVEPGGRYSPSSFARERMREIASKNAPFDDPDQQRPKWRRVISGVFPGFI
ncbi:putative RING finger membrane protein C15C4.06c [Cladobotryum mycophilum]|uniref:RING finger membrane protein C15C4.06c n=1 Tax=Cladobotryum mycophilum TaxID=491253 RepID=A0ABR0SKH4_9HYPO